jgi:flagellar motor switch protein FliM
MAATLAQKDIDALLHAGGRGTAAAPPLEVRLYDFVRPPRISRDRRAALEGLYGRFAAALQGIVTSRLRTPVDVLLIDIEQTTFGEFCLSLPSPCAAHVFSLGDRTPGQGVIDLGNPVAYYLIDRLFGGPGEAADLKRPLTPLEQTVARSLTERFLGLLRDAWQEQVPLTPELAGFESNPETLPAAGREDGVLVATLALRSAEFAGTLSVCLPMAPLEPWFQERTGGRPVSPRVGASDRPLLQAALRQAEVTVAARIPAVRLTARAAGSLRPGQTIDTGHPLDAPLEVYVNGRLSHLGSLGQLRRHFGLRITRSVPPAAPSRPAWGREGRIS